ncbi:MAG: PLP-dependent cysteine synthase family protein [Planctomycetota bacterium]|nr:PLP-dependent cysteine synthase family protein [Planctomycetota bacterium]
MSLSLDPAIEERLDSLRALIGDTRLMVIRCAYRGQPLTIGAKYEVQNFTGSIKDRMALHIMEDAYAHGAVKPGDTIVEATSGNTGIAFAAVGRALGHDVRIYMPDWMSRERVMVIQSLGAEIVPVTAEAGGFLGAIAQAEAFAAEHEGVFAPRQFETQANVDAHRLSTGPELRRQLEAAGLEASAFVAGVGTGGTVMGVQAYAQERMPGLRVHPLEPANSPTLRTGHRVGKHRIQGISDEFIPAIVDLEALDEIVDVWDGDAILMAQALASQFGLGVGISAGANFLGALKLAHEAGDGRAVATVFCDSNKKYLSTDLCREEPVLPEYLTPEVELLGCRVIPGPGLPWRSGL